MKKYETTVTEFATLNADNAAVFEAAYEIDNLAMQVASDSRAAARKFEHHARMAIEGHADGSTDPTDSSCLRDIARNTARLVAARGSFARLFRAVFGVAACKTFHAALEQD